MNSCLLLKKQDLFIRIKWMDHSLFRSDWNNNQACVLHLLQFPQWPFLSLAQTCSGACDWLLLNSGLSHSRNPSLVEIFYLLLCYILFQCRSQGQWVKLFLRWTWAHHVKTQIPHQSSSAFTSIPKGQPMAQGLPAVDPWLPHYSHEYLYGYKRCTEIPAGNCFPTFLLRLHKTLTQGLMCKCEVICLNTYFFGQPRAVPCHSVKPH